MTIGTLELYSPTIDNHRFKTKSITVVHTDLNCRLHWRCCIVDPELSIASCTVVELCKPSIDDQRCETLSGGLGTPAWAINMQHWALDAL